MIKLQPFIKNPKPATNPSLAKKCPFAGWIPVGIGYVSASIQLLIAVEMLIQRQSCLVTRAGQLVVWSLGFFSCVFHQLPV